MTRKQKRTRSKEGRGGRSDDEEGVTKRVKRKRKMKKWLEDASLTTSVLFLFFHIEVLEQY